MPTSRSEPRPALPYVIAPPPGGTTFFEEGDLDLSQPVLGIMTLSLGERTNAEERVYFRKLIVRAEKLGLRAFAFTPQDVDARNRRIYAHRYDSEADRWSREWSAFPQLIYDRCRYEKSERFQRFRRFRAAYPKLIYLNRPIANKWGMHQFLSQRSGIRQHMPATKVYESDNDLLSFLNNRRLVYLKPINGTGGRGIIRVERTSAGKYLIQGRNLQRKIVAPRLAAQSQLPQKLAGWKLKGSYLIQQGIACKLPDGRVHDFRLLIQKNGNGEWEVTGCAGRIGPKQSITSNLHGGGMAAPMTELLRRRFAEDDRIESIQKTVYRLGHDVAHAVEERFGQLCELGIDIAIDPDGHPWLLELNPKPAREVFSRIGEKETYEKAISRPLEYALWLYKQHKEAGVARRRRGRSKLYTPTTISQKIVKEGLHEPPGTV